MQETILKKRRRHLRELLREKALNKINVAVKELYRIGAEKVYIFGFLT